MVADTHLDRAIVESDSFNDVSWVSSFAVGPWKLHFILSEIQMLSSSLQVEFRHMLQSGNQMADTLAELGRGSSVFPFFLGFCNFASSCFAIISDA